MCGEAAKILTPRRPSPSIRCFFLSKDTATHKMSTGKLAITFLLLLFCIEYGESGVKKIKIHVPYYVKHVHHYKKVYVPKIHVIKHEHHHKKEYDHHHHHHEVYKHHGPYRSYDKSSHEYPDELQHQDVYYDDLESKSFHGTGRKRLRPFRYRSSSKEQYRGWKDVDGSDYSGEEEEDFSAYRKNIYFKRRVDSDKGDEDAEEVEDGEEEEKERNEEAEEEEEEDEEEDGEEATTPELNKEDIISITTTDNPIL